MLAAAMNPAIPIVLGALGASLAAFSAYVVARRQRSGKIDTSEAATLWAESQAMRKELRDETISLRAEVGALRSEAIAMRAESVALRAELVTLRAESAGMRAESVTMRDEMVLLRAESAARYQEVQELREELALRNEGDVP